MKDIVREAAIKCYLNIESGNVFVQDALTRSFKHYKLHPKQKRALHELIMGAVKMRGRLEYIINQFAKQDLSRWTKACLMLGLYQLIFSSGTPDYAAVNEFVELTARHENPGAASLVNAVLRRYQREQDKIKYPDKDNNPVGYLKDYYSLPVWICSDWVRRYGVDNAVKLAEWANSRRYPSLKLYSLLKSIPSDDYLLNEGFESNKYFSQYYNYIGKGDPRDSRPYKDSQVYFQDPSSGLAVSLSGAKPGDKILDVGASPGGKTLNLYEKIRGKGKLTAIEINKGKLKGLKLNLYRMGVDKVNIIGEDINSFRSTEEADIVLVDAPCSGLGTLARNADLRWRIRHDDLIGYSDQQSSMLNSASRFVKPGGRLIYSTCTLTEEENQNVINSFLHKNKRFKRIVISEVDGNAKKDFITSEGDLFVLPYLYNTDGAFISIMRRTVEKS
ncbi:MAG: 16S rRNA (cytosine(967)-C(5))-methyltransferase RsmB [candidate division Zixibacteria bacterium]|nr:16S rRNA (cytosine(967)-C(5))-methyltransferase RsmB [candidate division Zixibacteria bacterium]